MDNKNKIKLNNQFEILNSSDSSLSNKRIKNINEINNGDNFNEIRDKDICIFTFLKCF